MTLAALRFGGIAGVMCFASTLAANLAIIVFRPSDLCRLGPLSIIVFGLAGLFVFLFLAASAGFATGRADGSVVTATLAGVLVGAISGCATIALIPFGPAVMHRLQELSTLCPDGASFSGGGSFHFSLGATPPPGFVPPTPPPGFFPSPPPGAFAPPFGSAGVVLQVIGTLFGLAVGTGFAAGAAALAGLVGVATRPQASAS